MAIDTEFLEDTSLLPDALLDMMSKCQDCFEVRKLLKQLSYAAKHGTLLGEVKRQEETPTFYGEKIVDEHLRYLCPTCHNTGWALTDKGRAFLWFLHTMLPHVKPEWQRGLQEIPF